MKMTNVQEKFETILADLTSILNWHFRDLAPEAREEAVAEGVAQAWKNYIGLAARGAEATITAHMLAWYAVKSVRAGRRLGTGAAENDVLHASVGKRAERNLVALGDVAEELTANKKLNPAEIAGFRIDLATWMCGLTLRQRDVCGLLVAGFATGEIARLLGVSPAAVSIMRRTLETKWIEFQGE
jgi:DNA-directed RNA polymerase specialized sigma24 family protein